MLYWLAATLGFDGISNLVRYQTFRAGATLMTALAIGLIIGPKFISMLRIRQGKGQPIREDGPQSHLAKRGTPTMGGLMIVTSLILATLLWMNIESRFVWACLAVTIGFGAIGFMDDYDKVRKASHKGVSARVRLLLEFAVALTAAWLVVRETNLYVPFFSNLYVPLGPFYYLFAAFVIVGAGNAVNLTDGLDRSIHNSSDSVSAVRIISPPIVGVPRLAKWVCGPSSRIGWPLPCRTRSKLMKRGPMIMPITSAVISVAPARKLW